ncbi:MAG: hypothetical protein M3498_02290 [Deinococcota bacterium]|jgi:hypothetical protein|nr:hypothetical protein [Deinococcota bacterium]
MTREQARKTLSGTSLFRSRDGKVVVRDVTLIRAVQAYEQEQYRTTHRSVQAVN